MSETAEQMAERLQADVLATAQAEVTLVLASDGHPDPNPLTEAERDVLDLGITAGYAATMRVLVREGILPSNREADR